MDRSAEFLSGQKILRLATVDDRGIPHVVPVWYLYRDSMIYIGTNTRTAKAKNVRRTGWAAFCADEGVRSPIRGVMGRGRAALLTEAGFVDKMARAILLRYFDSMEEPSAQDLLRETDCIIQVGPLSLTRWDY